MKTISWNQDWKFWKEKNAFNLIFKVPKDAQTVCLPHDAMFQEAQDPESVNEGRTGFLNGGLYNYYKELVLQPEDKGRQIFLLIEGAFDQMKIFVNGSVAGACNYAYQKRYYDITEYLEAEKENTILIVTQTMDLSTRYYSGAGLTRGVYLCRAESIDIRPFSLRVSTLQIEDDGVMGRIQTDICNCGRGRYLDIRLQVYDKDHQEKLQVVYPVRLAARETQHFEKTLFIPDVLPWDEQTPEQYTVCVTLEEDGKVISSEKILTGFRTISVDSRHGLRVNGKPVLLRGGAIHHDQGFLGAATYEEYEYRRIQLMKEAGFNAVRSAHNPASTALLNACDRLGVYILDEAFDVWGKRKNNQDSALFFDVQWEAVLSNMVDNDYNHPSVLAYSTGNEITELGTEAGFVCSRKMTELLHTLDATRFVTNGINGIFASGNRLLEPMADEAGVREEELENGDINEIMQYIHPVMGKVVQHKTIDWLMDRLEATMDVLGYNYLTERYEKDAREKSGRIMVGTETFPSQIAENWAIIKRLPAVIGEFTWTGYQYMGETGGKDAYPLLAGESGDLDRMGKRRPISYYREIVFGLRKEPYLAICDPDQMDQPRQSNPWMFTNALSRWDFKNAAGKPVRVEVYGAGKWAELYLNGENLGRKALGEVEPYLAVFEVNYDPGTLSAVTYDENGEVGRYTLESPGEPEKLILIPEELCIEDGDLRFIRLQLCDRAGRVVTNYETEVSIQVSEGAELLAFASGKTGYDCGYRKNSVKLEDGCALIIIKKDAFSHGSIIAKCITNGILEACAEL